MAADPKRAARIIHFVEVASPYLEKAVRDFLVNGVVQKATASSNTTSVVLILPSNPSFRLYASASTIRSLSTFIKCVLKEQKFLQTLYSDHPVYRDDGKFSPLCWDSDAGLAISSRIRKLHPDLAPLHRAMRNRMAPDVDRVSSEMGDKRQESARKALRKLFRTLRLLKMSDPEIVEFVRDEINVQGVEGVMEA